MDNEQLRERFIQTYANIPLNLREEIVLVYDKKPVTWNVVYFEVKVNSKGGQEMLEQLSELEII